MMEKDCLTVDASKDFHSHLCREDHFDHDAHMAQLTELEEGWQTNYDGIEHQGLCALPPLAADASVAKLWIPTAATSNLDTAGDGNRPQGVSSAVPDDMWNTAREEGNTYRRLFEIHVQVV